MPAQQPKPSERSTAGLGHALISVGGVAVLGTPIAVGVAPKDVHFSLSHPIALLVMGVGGACVLLGLWLHFESPPPRLPRRFWRKPPNWRDHIGQMVPRQIAHLEALEHERAGYVRRKLRSRVKQVDEQIKRARDAWWESEPTPEVAVGERALRSIQVPTPPHSRAEKEAADTARPHADAIIEEMTQERPPERKTSNKIMRDPVELQVWVGTKLLSPRRVSCEVTDPSDHVTSASVPTHPIPGVVGTVLGMSAPQYAKVLYPSEFDNAGPLRSGRYRVRWIITSPLNQLMSNDELDTFTIR